jgi:hypothetical protein
LQPEEAPRQLLELPYDQRRMVVVIKSKPVVDDEPDPTWMHVVTSVLASALSAAVPGLLGIGAARAAASRFRKHAEEDDVDGELLLIGAEEAAQLRFPIGHPRKRVLYVGHPVDAPVYVPVAQFHTFLFDHKVAEAIRLIRSLGADSVEVVRLEGWGQDAGIHVNIPVPGLDQVEIGASAERNKASSNFVMTKMTLNPTESPHLPEDLVWFPHEPLWQEVAEARLRSGLTSFSLDVRSTDDYGVNAGLKLLVAKSGLDAGGNFVEHKTTIWRVQGTFAK